LNYLPQRIEKVNKNPVETAVQEFVRNYLFLSRVKQSFSFADQTQNEEK
jgi:hypothetical protein